jgi:hypothetical protein
MEGSATEVLVTMAGAGKKYFHGEKGLPSFL